MYGTNLRHQRRQHAQNTGTAARRVSTLQRIDNSIDSTGWKLATKTLSAAHTPCHCHRQLCKPCNASLLYKDGMTATAVLCVPYTHLNIDLSSRWCSMTVDINAHQYMSYISRCVLVEYSFKFAGSMLN
jgi:hypothetical protein